MDEHARNRVSCASKKDLEERSRTRAGVLMKKRIAGTLIVLLHLAATLVHGRAHSELGIGTSSWQSTFIALVIVAGPLIAMTLLWTRLRVTGIFLLAVTMIGSLVFGVSYHFLISGGDNALELSTSHWGSVFVTSAVLLTLIESGGFAWCAWALRSKRSSF
jgi:cation transport ATPase